MPRRAKPKQTVSFSNLPKVFFPETGFTKGELIKYYIDVAPVLVPHFRDRPVTLIRMPDGVRGEKFYEKNAPRFTPEWVETTEVPRSEGGVINYIMINDAPTLAWCANNGAVEFHPFLHRAANLEMPTHIAFDLDPGEGADLLTCIEIAGMIRDLLGALKLQAFPKVSGSKGLQLYVPLNTPVTYEVATPFAKAVAELLHAQHPDLIVSDMAKALRVNRVFIDWSQNNQKKTTVGPYSVRGKRDAPFVSAPVTWDELARAAKARKIDRLFFTPKEVLERVARHGDLFAPVLKLKQKLPADVLALAPKANTKSAPRSLRRYAEKRDFSKTAEPAPAAVLPSRSAEQSRRFVIQKHAASHLHYDFRLEMNGVLKSWAVPKGLATEVGVRRSAFQTEDHPVEYFSFEGTIPAGQYGGGTVMVWDVGTYDVIGGSYWKGDLKLRLKGKKLAGEWHIFRIKSPDDKPVWLIQKADTPAKPLTKEQENTSVLTHRTMEQIAKAKDAVWQSKEADGETTKPVAKPSAAKTKVRATRRTRTAVAQPKWVEPMAARETSALPDDANWLYEIKWDGYRGIALKQGEEVRLLSRKEKNLGSDFPAVVDALRTIHADTAVLDGEIVALDENGRPSFQNLQNRRSSAAAIVYYAFDLLSLDGEDWRQKPLEERKAKLTEIVADSEVKLSLSFDGPVKRIVAQVQKLGLEGVIAKRRDSAYEAGERSGAWLKMKFAPEQEFVIGGYKRGTPLESLVIGYYEDGKLLCAGKVRQGLNPRNRKALAAQLRTLRTENCPFANLPHPKKSRWGEGITAEQMKEIQWVKPETIAQVSFAEWTSGGNLRHGTFKGLRDDKSPRDVVRET